MSNEGLYGRARDRLLEILPYVKGETLSREAIHRMCNINPNNPEHIEFRDAVNEVLYQWSTVNKIKDKVIKNGGGFKFVDNELKPMNLMASRGSEFELVLPFGIHNYCFLYRKNIMIVYGSKDAGKTAFLLNIVRMNMQKHRMVYFSSEMAEDEMRNRLISYNGLELEQWDFEPYERSYDFDQVIQPDACNLIDFLELGGDDNEYYKGVLLVRRIYDKLDNGVAIIACQKNTNAEFPKGGEGLLEKARIAVSLDSGQATLKVAKNWRKGQLTNPKGRSWTYNLVGGINYVNIMEG